MDVGRGEKHLPRGLTGRQSSAKKCRMGTACREQTPPSWCLLARGVRPCAWHVMQRRLKQKLRRDQCGAKYCWSTTAKAEAGKPAGSSAQ